MTVKTVKINGLSFDISEDEFNFLMKQHEDDRLESLCSLRYEFHVLTKQGKKKVETFDLIKARQAIRFACIFFKVGSGGISERAKAGNDTAIQQSAEVGQGGSDHKDGVQKSND